MDSGVLDLDFQAEIMGSKAYAIRKKARLRDRIDAAIAHEYEEAKSGGSHAYALEPASETGLPIGERVRALLSTIRTGVQATRGGGPSLAW